MIRYSEQTIEEDDIKKVKDVLKSKFLTSGPISNQFEKIICKKIGSKFATSFNSATSALHIACLSLGLSSKDYLWTSVNSFVASSNCGLYCGAKIDFIDISKNDYNLDIDKLEEKLKYAKKKQKLPKIIVPVCFGGKSCDMKKLNYLSKKYGFFIVEDASHAFGAKYKNKHVGCGKYSTITIFSFHPVKILTTCEGGVATTNQKKLYEKMSILKSHGIIRKNFLNKNLNAYKDLYYEQQYLGYNYRLNEIESALGISQVKKTFKFIKARREIAKRYIKGLNKKFLNFQKEEKDIQSSYHLFVIWLKNKNRNNLIKYLKKNKIMTNIHYIPIVNHPYYKNKGFKEKDFPIAQDYFKNALSIPIFPNLSKIKQDLIIKKINSFLKIK